MTKSQLFAAAHATARRITAQFAANGYPTAASYNATKTYAERFALALASQYEMVRLRVKQAAAKLAQAAHQAACAAREEFTLCERVRGCAGYILGTFRSLEAAQHALRTTTDRSSDFYIAHTKGNTLLRTY